MDYLFASCRVLTLSSKHHLINFKASLLAINSSSDAFLYFRHDEVLFDDAAVILECEGAC